MKTRRQFLHFASAPATIPAPGAPPEAQNAALFGAAADASFPPDGVAPPKTIDWHNHWTPARAARLPRRRPAERDAGVSPEWQVHVPAHTNIDARIEHLDKVGIERQVMSLGSGPDIRLDDDEARTWSTIANDELAEIVTRHPARFSGYAAVPTSDVEWGANELRRAYRDLGLIGVVIPVGALHTLEGARRLAPIFEVSQEFKGIVYFHSGPASPKIPGQPMARASRDDDPVLRARFDKADYYAHGITTATQTGFLDPYPDVTVIFAMLGGLAPFFFATTAARRNDRDSIAKLRRVHVDASTSRAPRSLWLAAKVFGPDRVLFGSDFGAWPSIAPIISAVHRSELTSEQKTQVFVENGQRILSAKGKPRKGQS